MAGKTKKRARPKVRQRMPEEMEKRLYEKYCSGVSIGELAEEFHFSQNDHVARYLREYGYEVHGVRKHLCLGCGKEFISDTERKFCCTPCGARYREREKRNKAAVERLQKKHPGMQARTVLFAAEAKAAGYSYGLYEGKKWQERMARGDV